MHGTNTAETVAAMAIVMGLALGSLATPATAESMDDEFFTQIIVDEIEYQARDGSDLIAWDGQARIGNDDHKVALKTRGEYSLDHDAFERAELQALYLWPFDEFVDFEVGLRHDLKPEPDRTYAVFGLNGLAPHWFEVDTSMFVSERGDVSARLEGEYDILLTQQLVLQPKAELDLAASDDRSTGVGAGVGTIEAGLRLRYEFTREFAPYVGMHWERKFGKTARFAREEGEDTNDLAAVIGIRMAF